MTFDDFIKNVLKKDAKEKCTLEIKQRIWLRLAKILLLDDAV